MLYFLLHFGEKCILLLNFQMVMSTHSQLIYKMKDTHPFEGYAQTSGSEISVIMERNKKPLES